MATSSSSASQPVAHHQPKVSTDDDGVEVQAAEVGADPPGPAEPVAVGDVGVERRPDEVEPGPHGAGLGAAVAGGGGVTELVEAAGQHRHHEDEQQQVRRWKASYAEAPRPRSKNTHQPTATKPRTTARRRPAGTAPGTGRSAAGWSAGR